MTTELLDPAITGDAEDGGRSARAMTTPAALWSAARLPVVVGLIIAVVGTTIALLAGGVRGGLLDPEAARPPGSKALAALLRDRGVDVVRVPEPTAESGTTLFVPRAELLDADVDLSLLLPSADRDVVLVSPGAELLEALRGEAPGLDIRVAGGAEVTSRPAGCAVHAAAVAGRARTGGELYAIGGPDSCYRVDGLGSVVVVHHGGGELRVVGAPDAFTNAELGDEGNAALAIGLLEGQPRIEWVYPREDERAALGTPPRSLVDLLPDRVALAAVQLVVAAVWFGVWRARRLGPVVAETLPVVVRAAETVEGRARLYRTAQARQTAAAALQAARRRRIARAIGLGVAPVRDELLAAVATRTGRDAAAVDDLLYGRSPADDAALVRLARDLDTLDSEVRTL